MLGIGAKIAVIGQQAIMKKVQQNQLQANWTMNARLRNEKENVLAKIEVCFFKASDAQF